MTFRNIGYMVKLGNSAFVSEASIACMMFLGNYVFIHVPKLLTPEQAKELEKKKTETEVKAQEEPEAEEVEEKMCIRDRSHSA